MADVDVLVIGAGLAGAGCVEALREEGFGGSILLVGREPDPPYDRSAVSKGYLAGNTDREGALQHPDSWYGENDIDLRTRTSVMKLDAAQKIATLSSKEDVSYGRALLAPGAHVRRLPVDGSDLEGIHYLRALRNADVLRADVDGVDKVVVIGGSYIGTEVAASLTTLGKQVSVVMLEDVVHERSFGAQAGGGSSACWRSMGCRSTRARRWRASRARASGSSGSSARAASSSRPASSSSVSAR